MLTKKAYYCTYSPSNACINKYFLIYKNKQSNTPATRDYYLEKRIMQKRLTEDNSSAERMTHSHSPTRETQEARFGLLVRSGYSDTRRMGCFGRSERLDQKCCRVVILPTTEEMPPPVQLRLPY